MVPNIVEIYSETGVKTKRERYYIKKLYELQLAPAAEVQTLRKRWGTCDKLWKNYEKLPVRENI